MTADPVPENVVLPHYGKSAVLKTDASRIDIIFAFQFLELKARVRRIALKKPKGPLGVPLNVEGQTGK